MTLVLCDGDTICGFIVGKELRTSNPPGIDSESTGRLEGFGILEPSRLGWVVNRSLNFLVAVCYACLQNANMSCQAQQHIGCSFRIVSRCSRNIRFFGPCLKAAYRRAKASNPMVPRSGAGLSHLVLLFPCSAALTCCSSKSLNLSRWCEPMRRRGAGGRLSRTSLGALGWCVRFARTPWSIAPRSWCRSPWPHAW